MLHVAADELPRFMACNGSLAMGSLPSLPIAATSSTQGEGIAAHWLAEQVFTKQHGTDELIDRQAPNGVFITADMVEHVQLYLDTIGYDGVIEHDTSFSDGAGVWQINARADHATHAGRQLIVTDFKYGWSIVEPEENWTLIAHAIGFGLQLTHQQGVDLLKDIDQVVLRIVQPRAYHHVGKVREWVITPQQLVEYHQRINAVLSNPVDELNTSKHCRYCPAMSVCPAFQQAQMNAIEASEAVFADEISNDSLSFMLDNIKRAQEVLDQAYKAYADLAQSRLKEGQIVTNYAVQNELTNRQWRDWVTPEMATAMTGKDLTKKQLITPAQAEKKGVPKEVMESLCERRNKGTKLVRIDANKLAKKLFN